MSQVAQVLAVNVVGIGAAMMFGWIGLLAFAVVIVVLYLFFDIEVIP